MQLTGGRIYFDGQFKGVVHQGGEVLAGDRSLKMLVKLYALTGRQGCVLVLSSLPPFGAVLDLSLGNSAAFLLWIFPSQLI